MENLRKAFVAFMQKELKLDAAQVVPKGQKVNVVLWVLASPSKQPMLICTTEEGVAELRRTFNRDDNFRAFARKQEQEWEGLVGGAAKTFLVSMSKIGKRKRRRKP